MALVKCHMELDRITNGSSTLGMISWGSTRGLQLSLNSTGSGVAGGVGSIVSRGDAFFSAAGWTITLVGASMGEAGAMQRV